MLTYQGGNVTFNLFFFYFNTNAKSKQFQQFTYIIYVDICIRIKEGCCLNKFWYESIEFKLTQHSFIHAFIQLYMIHILCSTYLHVKLFGI